MWIVRDPGYLQQMGITDAFGTGDNPPDFSRIHPEEALEISDSRHKSFVSVNEEGTEAAAVTSVEIISTSIIVKNLCGCYMKSPTSAATCPPVAV